jgi:hypothetical protein
MEAEYSQYDLDDVNIKALLTNNMRLYNKFIKRKDTSEVLEKSINLVGLEHLVRVNLIDDILEEWEEQTKT